MTACLRDHIPLWIRRSDTHKFGEAARWEDRRVVFVDRPEGHPCSKPVECYDETGYTRSFESVGEAARELGIARGGIDSALRTGWRCAGYKWRRV